MMTHNRHSRWRAVGFAVARIEIGFQAIDEEKVPPVFADSKAYKGRREADEAKKRAYIEKYIPQVAVGLERILGLNEKQRDKIVSNLTGVLERTRKL